VSDVATGDGLPDRLHDILLRMAGRVDDDALTSARELVAIAESDRAVELLVGCLIAGGVPVTPAENGQLRALLDQSRSDPSLADRLKVRDTWYAPPHRFSYEPDAGAGVGAALAPVVDFLIGVQSVHAVWRVTPAGATPGAVPQRVVLVEIGPDGFAPATAYRVAQALEVAGIRAVVEVLKSGADRSDYHRLAASDAKPINLSGQHAAAPASGGGRRAKGNSTVVPIKPVAHAEAKPDAVAQAEPPTAVEPVAVEKSAPQPPVLEPSADPSALGLVDYQPIAEDKLSDVERDLLRQLHEELAQREQ
jgi:hypothetical protein